MNYPELFPNFLPYVLVSLFHLACCAANKQTLRHASKILLLPCLLLAYLTAAQALAWPYYCALFLGWVGDIFLIWPNDPVWQKAGTASFAVGHIFYILLLVRRIAACDGLWLVWLPPVVFAAAAVAIYLWQRPLIPKDLRATGLGYYIVLAVVASLAGIAWLGGITGGVWLLLGGVMFLTSDSILCRQFFTVGDPAPKYDFAVMLTYVLAQLCLCLGFIAPCVPKLMLI